MSKKKSSQKTTVDDFLSLLMEEENYSQPVAFSPVLNSMDAKQEIKIGEHLSKQAIRDTNPAQTGHETLINKNITQHEQDTNGTQTAAQNEINEVITAIRDTNPAQTGHERDTKPDTIRDTKSEGTGHKRDTNLKSEHEFEHEVRSLKKGLAVLFATLCERSLNAGEFEITTTYSELAYLSGIKRTSIETTLKRLCLEKNLFQKTADLGGGDAQIYVTVPQRSLMLYAKYRTILQNKVSEYKLRDPAQTGHKRDTKPDTNRDTNRDTNVPSKLDSIININSNLTGDLTSKSNSTNWFAQLNFSNVPVHPSQVNPLIRQLVLQNLTREDVQNFIDRFTSWAATQKGINKPVGMFCEKLKAYAVDGDSDVLLVMTEQDRRQEAEFSAQIEKARLEMELIERTRRHESEKNAADEFEVWYASAADDELNALLKPSSFMPFKSEIYKLSIKQTYLEKKNNLGERL